MKQYQGTAKILCSQVHDKMKNSKPLARLKPVTLLQQISALAAQLFILWFTTSPTLHSVVYNGIQLKFSLECGHDLSAAKVYECNKTNEIGFQG